MLPDIECKTVLCWVGSIEQSEATVHLACTLANSSQGRCLVVLGLDSPARLQGSGVGGREQRSHLTPELISMAERKLAKLYGEATQTMVLPGHPIAEVRRYAKHHGVDLVVMGEQAIEIEREYGERLMDDAPSAMMIYLAPRRSPPTHATTST